MQHYYINNYNTGIVIDEKFRIFELSPTHSRKSFYGKCKVIENEAGYYLQSYNTIVCGFEFGNFIRYWSGYSVTTMRHINAFLVFLGFACNIGGKKWWNCLEVNKEYTTHDILNIGY